MLSSAQAPFQVAMQVPALVAYLCLNALAAVIFPALFALRRRAVVSWPAVLAANASDTPPGVVEEARRQLAAGRRFVAWSNAAVSVMAMCGCAIVLALEHGWCGSALALMHTFQAGVVFGDAEAGYGRWFENAAAIGCAVALYVAVNLSHLATSVNSFSPEAPADAFARTFIRTTGRIVSQVAITVSMYLIQFLIAYARERTHRFVFLAGTSTAVFRNHVSALKSSGADLVASQLPSFVVESQRHAVAAAQMAALSGGHGHGPASSPAFGGATGAPTPAASSSRASADVSSSRFASSDATPAGAGAGHVVVSLGSTSAAASPPRLGPLPQLAPAIAGMCTVVYVSVAAPQGPASFSMHRSLQPATPAVPLAAHVEAIDAAYRLCDDLAAEAGVDKVSSTGSVW
jgi:hypothetical protein